MKDSHRQVGPWYRQVKFWHFIIYTGLLTIVLVSGYLEYRSRYWDILELYQDYTQATVTAITYSGSSQTGSREDLEQLLVEMLAIEGITYIFLQPPDSEPLLVSGHLPYSAILSGQHQLLQENLFLVNVAGRLFIEVNDYIYQSDDISTIRVGFITAPIDNLKNSVLNQILWRSGLITTTMIVAFFFIISRQNAMLLRSEKKRMEEDVIRLEKLNRIQEKQVAIGTLAAGLAHEIRNPLNTIGILAQRLKRDFSGTDHSAAINNISGTMVTEIERLNLVIKEFLEYARPIPLNPVKFDLADIISDIELVFRESARERKVDLIIENGAGIVLEGDRDYIKQALGNVFRNALEATSENGRVTMNFSPETTALKISITDTGTGIDQDRINRIFDIFYTTKENGNGIGLAVTHKIISDHGGTIDVKSVKGSGTEFIITLPWSQS